MVDELGRVIPAGYGVQVLAVPAAGASDLRAEHLVPRLRVPAPPQSRRALTVWIEAPEGWGPRQMLMTSLEGLGYHVDMVGAGDVWRLVLR